MVDWSIFFFSSMSLSGFLFLFWAFYINESSSLFLFLIHFSHKVSFSFYFYFVKFSGGLHRLENLKNRIRFGFRFSLHFSPTESELCPKSRLFFRQNLQWIYTNSDWSSMTNFDQQNNPLSQITPKIFVNWIWVNEMMADQFTGEIKSRNCVDRCDFSDSIRNKIDLDTVPIRIDLCDVDRKILFHLGWKA